MILSNFWKEAYKDFWEMSSQKEIFIKTILEKETGLTVSELGLGAGSFDYIQGSASDNNVEKGDADLYIEQIDAYLEVTGPNIPMKRHAVLWFRPDKLNNAYLKIKAGKGKIHALIHVQEVKGTKEKLIRCVVLDREFFKRAKKGEFKTVNPKIRGVQEKYIEIYLNDKSIITFEELINRLNRLK